MKTKTVAKWIRTAPRKVRRFADLIRGKSLQEARAILAVQSSPAAAVLSKCLESAVADAENNHDMDPDELVVAEVYADEGFRIPRLQPRARGRADRKLRRTCHITIALSDEEEDMQGR